MSDKPRYGTNLTNTSKFMEDLLNEFIKMPKGVFNLNRRKIQDVCAYAITPIESWEMLPNSDVYLKYDIQMLTKHPTVKRLLSGMTAELRVYKAKKLLHCQNLKTNQHMVLIYLLFQNVL